MHALSGPARRALLIAAAHTGTDLPVIAAACRRVGTAVVQLAEAEAHGLVRLAPGLVTFAHPLVRGLVYSEASPAERRAAHGALAAALPGDRSAWHLAVATIGPDETVAQRLEEAGGRAAARRAYAASAEALERAARLTPDPDTAGRRLLVAGQAAAGAGLADRALALLTEAAEVSIADEQRARAQQLRGRMLVWRGQGAEATPLLVEQAGRIAGRWPELAALMLSDAANGATTTNSCRAAEQLAQRAAGLLSDTADPGVRGAVLTMLGWTLVLCGKAPQARPVLAEANRLASGLDRTGPDWPWLHLLLRAHIPLGEFEQALTESQEVCQCAQDAGALATLSSARLVTADAAFRLGDWEMADRAALQTVQLAGDAGQPVLAGYALTIRTRLLAARGDEAGSRAEATAALQIAESCQIGSGLRFVHASLGFLELSLDRVDSAVGELERARRLTEGSGMAEPTIVPWAPDLVEAYARQGRTADARRLLACLGQQAELTASPVAAAAAARCRALLDDDFDSAFTHALALHEVRPMPFEQARTLLAFGRRLHRARRRAEARDRLRAAMRGFHDLNAHVWAGQAEAELRAAGARRSRAPGGSMLTPQEQRVAAAVQRGESNRAIAAELFLSARTVEYHLGQIYRKLGVRSRTQLVAALSGQFSTAKPR